MILDEPSNPFRGHNDRYQYIESISGNLEDTVCFVKAKRTIPYSNDNRCEVVAVKCYRRPIDARRMRYLRREAIALKRIRSPHVITLLEVFVSLSHVCLAVEYVNGGALYNYIQRHCFGLDESQAKTIFNKILLGLRDLHSLDIVSRDIKPRNILYDENTNIIKIHELGFAKLNSTNCKTKLGTVLYVPPEVLNLSVYDCENAPYDGKCADVWSLGVTLYFMLFNRYPFKINPKRGDADFIWEAMKQVIHDSEIYFPKDVSLSCQNILRKMLIQNPQERATISKLLEDPWIREGLNNHELQYQPLDDYCFQSEEQICNTLHFAIITSISDCVDLTNS